MSSIGGIRDHMRSIQKTVQISNAQKLIAGARIIRAHKTFEHSQMFHERIRLAAASILGDCEAENKFLDTGQEVRKRVLLVFSADRGLSGGYNQNIMKLAAKTMADTPIVRLLVVGDVGFGKFARMDVPIDRDFRYSVEKPEISTARKIAERMIEMFERDEADCFDVLYTSFRSAAHMGPSLERLFPLSPEALGAPRVHFAEYSPSADEVLEILMPRYLKGYLFGCLVQAWICELSSRIRAMDGAIKNGNEMLAKLSLQYNRLRQGAITQEISEIVAGAASMEGEEDI